MILIRYVKKIAYLKNELLNFSELSTEVAYQYPRLSTGCL